MNCTMLLLPAKFCSLGLVVSEVNLKCSGRLSKRPAD